MKLCAVFQTDCLQRVGTGKFQNRCPNDRNFRWEVYCRLQTVSQQSDGADNREKFLDFMKSILTITKNGDGFTAVEKSITDGTVADPMSFKLCEIFNFQSLPGSSGSEDDGACFDLCGSGRNEIIAVPADPYNLIL